MAIQTLASRAGECRYWGLSSDTKPDPSVSDGHGFYETDTGNGYLCDGVSWNPTTTLDGITGGTTGQFLKKASNTDFDFAWQTIAGGGDMLAANNLSDLANITTARTNLGVAIGTDVQAYDADLTTWAGITPAAGIGTFLATPSSANLISAVTDETGTGALVFANTPTLVSPILGTPTSGTLTNCTFPTLNQDTTGSAAKLTTARTIGGVNFDGTANIVPQTIQSINEATDTTCFPLFISASGSQSLQPLNNAGFIYNSNTNSLTATTFIGALTGTASGNLVSGGALGTPSSGTLANCTFPTLNQDTTGYASALKSASTTVDVAAATAPSANQVLTATDSTHATWQTPTGGADYKYYILVGGYI